MNWELRPNLRFTVENKMGNLLIDWGFPHFKLNMTEDIFHVLEFKEFINELEKICFSLGKIEF